MKDRLLNPLSMFVVGLCLGVISRLLDIYTEHLGNMFSQMAVWILLGVIISAYSKTAVKAMLNVLPFCLGMLIAYYAVAMITRGVYDKVFITGWTGFALCSPVMAYLAWMSKENGVFPMIVRIGIVGVSLLSSILLFQGPRVYDYVIDGLLIYFLFFKRIQR